MKNLTRLRSMAIDFAILTVIFFVLASIFLFSEKVLYKKESCEGRLVIISEALPTCHRGKISTGDVLYDTVTKRRAGEVVHVDEIPDADKIRLLITVDASSVPKSNALRSERLWFYYKMEDVCGY